MMKSTNDISEDSRLITLEQVRYLVPYSISQIYRMIKAGTFPAQIRLGPNRVAWRYREIIDWLDNRTNINR